MVYRFGLTVLILFLAVRSGWSRCNREPEDATTVRSPVGNKYRLEFSGKDEKYSPGEPYRVTLKGARTDLTTHTFSAFTIALESEKFWGDDSPARVGNISTLGDALTMYGVRCPNTVVQTSSVPKSEVQVLWKAPPAGNGCVLFRAMVIDQPNVWYMDDGRLTMRLCESEQANLDKQPEVTDPCCACEEAKYEMTFEGMWSRYTHPKDFPENSWVTRFSDIIGASHTAQYRFWKYGGYASEGLRQVAERGTTRALESELKAKSQHIRTIVKARGIGFPNVTGKTFAVFRVDRKHHLLSIVSMIDPSPDWIVGVSGLELCNTDCTWAESITLNLYPWDVGTDNGITYMSEDSPNPEPEPIQPITSKWPDDERSPFFDSNGEAIKPLAKIQLTRQRLYEKTCETKPDSQDHSSQDSECATTAWQEFGDCIPSCGLGWKRSQREYINHEVAYKHGCNVPLTRRERCESEPCTDKIPVSAERNPMCEVTEWGDWSECSSPCGGTMTRERSYVHHRAYKFCSTMYDAPDLQETIPCDPDPDAGDCSTQTISSRCPVTPWSDFSPCSTTCGNGTRVRTRNLLLAPDSDAQMLDSMEETQDEYMMNREELTEIVPDCSHVKLTDIIHCRGLVDRCIINMTNPLEMCTLPPKEGPCRMQSLRWYFDAETDSCQSFNFGGCLGNENNFGSQQECEEVCRDAREDSTTEFPTTWHPPSMDVLNLRSSPDTTYYRVSTTTPPEDEEVSVKNLQEERERVHCRLTQWSEWSPCSATCGHSVKARTRHIKVHPRNGGRPCNKRLRRVRKCQVPPCDYSREMQSDESPSWVREDPLFPGVDCELSEWSSWSPCSMSCGSNAVKQRTRSILVEPTSGGLPCGRRIDISFCSLPRCKD